MSEDLTTAKAIKHIVNALKEDYGYYYSWQSNIAMAFQDEFRREYLHKGLHEISNNAAKNFLSLLMQPQPEQSQADNGRCSE